MLSAINRSRAFAPPGRPNAGRWSAARSTAAHADTAATHATSDEFAWGYAIRREWANGCHDLFGFTPDAQIARGWLDRDRDFWRCGPVRPTAAYVVPTDATSVRQHPVGGCRSSRCPDFPDRGQR